MKKSIGVKWGIFPMPVLMIATYNEDGSIDVMNAARWTMFHYNQVILDLDESHKTVKNIMKRNAFTVSFANAKNVVAADYVWIVSGNDTPDKFKKSWLTAIKSEKVDAPIINEFPICLECKLIEGISDHWIVGEIVDVLVDENVMNWEKIDISAVEALAFDPYANWYYKISERVWNAFSDGSKLK